MTGGGIMAIEFLRLKLRRRQAAPVLLSGAAVLHVHGALDLFGDAIGQSGTIAAVVDDAQTSATPIDFPLDAVLGDPCATCPLAKAGCTCLQVDRYRVDGVESLAPMLIRPGLPIAVADTAGGKAPAALWQTLALFRSNRPLERGRRAA